MNYFIAERLHELSPTQVFVDQSQCVANSGEVIFQAICMG